MTRKDAINRILEQVTTQDVIIASTGLTSRELYAIRDRDLNFYMMGSMGSALAIGLGIALNTKRRVFVINGDGSALMSLGTMITHRKLYPTNLYHYILDNNAHNSTGGQLTASKEVNFEELAPNTIVYKIDNNVVNISRIPLSCEQIQKRFKEALSVKFTTPIVSILIPCFKRLDLLKWGLQSLSEQKSSYPFEVIILNDGIPDDTEKLCKQYSNKLNIRYIFTGDRNLKGGIIWRCPGFCLNIGVKQALSDYIIFSSSEIFHLDKLAIKKIVDKLKTRIKILVRPNGKDDQKSTFLNHVKATKGIVDKNFNINSMEVLNTEMPFFLGMHKEDFLCIGGYDEDLTGWAYDDTDLIARLKRYGCKILTIESTIVHLYHPRHNLSNPEIKSHYKKNKDLYEYKDREGVVYSNTDKEWGVLHSNDISVSKKYIREKLWQLKNIPKIAHFYWGNDKLPYLRYLTILSFRMYNPDWKINVYTPRVKYTGKLFDTQSQFKFTGNDYYSNLKKLNVEIKEVDFNFVNNICDGLSNTCFSRQEVYKSDFLRWYLLFTTGGLWSDMDIMYFKPMINLTINKKENKNMTTGISLHPKYNHSVGFMLSSSGNPYYKYIFDISKKNFNPNEYQSIGVSLLNKDFYNVPLIEKRFPNLKNKVKNISVKTVYAYDALVIPTIYNYKDMGRFTYDSIGLHWYAGHHLAKKYINGVNHLNYSDFDNVLIRTVKKVYGTY